MEKQRGEFTRRQTRERRANAFKVRTRTVITRILSSRLLAAGELVTLEAEQREQERTKLHQREFQEVLNAMHCLIMGVPKKIAARQSCLPVYPLLPWVMELFKAFVGFFFRARARFIHDDSFPTAMEVVVKICNA
jgi:hypothetical protein